MDTNFIIAALIGAAVFFILLYVVIKAALKKTNNILTAIAINQGTPLGFLSLEEMHDFIEANRDALGLIGSSDNTNPEYVRIKANLIKNGIKH